MRGWKNSILIIERLCVDLAYFVLSKYFRMILDAGERYLEGVAGHPVHVFGFYAFRGKVCPQIDLFKETGQCISKVCLILPSEKL